MTSSDNFLIILRRVYIYIYRIKILLFILRAYVIHYNFKTNYTENFFFVRKNLHLT